MSEGVVPPKRGLFQSLSKRMSGYRNKRKNERNPSSPRSQTSESASEGQRSVDNVDLSEVDLLEVQVSGKSARSARRLTSRHGLVQLRSAPAGALQAAAEQAVADHLEGSSASNFARASEDFSSHSSAYSPLSARSRYNRSQSHMDLPKQGSAAIALDTAASSSSSGGLMSPYSLVSPAAAPAVQQTSVAPTAPQGSNQMSSQIQQLSRKISGNKTLLSTSSNMVANNGEILLPAQPAPFAHVGRAFDDLEICFSGKSARMSRNGLRRPGLHTIAAH